MPTQVELQFRAQGGGKTQNEKLAAYLRSRPNQWIAMPDLAKVITETGIGAAVHSRVADCRSKFGMTILHRGGRRGNCGQCESWYLYDDGTGEQSATANPGGSPAES